MVDPNVVVTVVGTIIVAGIGARANSHAKRALGKAETAASNTAPNGHGPLPEAVGEVIESVKELRAEMGAVDGKVDDVMKWQSKHELYHAVSDARVEGRLAAGADMLSRLELKLAEKEGKIT